MCWKDLWNRQTWEWQRSVLFTKYCLEITDTATPNCKVDWEMWLERNGNGFQWKANNLPNSKGDVVQLAISRSYGRPHKGWSR